MGKSIEVILMGLNYEKEQTKNAMRSVKSPNEKLIAQAGKFPNCKGLYPDCPEVPDANCSMCKTCPKTDKMKLTPAQKKQEMK